MVVARIVDDPLNTLEASLYDSATPKVKDVVRGAVRPDIVLVDIPPVKETGVRDGSGEDGIRSLPFRLLVLPLLIGRFGNKVATNFRREERENRRRAPEAKYCQT